MPRSMFYIGSSLVALTLMPAGLIYKSARPRQEPTPRIQVVYDMDSSPSTSPRPTTPFFADGRAMRACRSTGTVARGQLHADDAFAAAPARSTRSSSTSSRCR